VVLVAAGAAALLRPRPAPSPIPVEPKAAGPRPAQQPTGAAPAPARPPAPVQLPVRSASPSAAEVRTLLEGWLAAKAAVLAGKTPAVPLDQLARDNQLQRLAAEQREDKALNQTQRINARVVTLRLEDSNPTRIAALVTIDYTGQRLDAAGQPVGKPTRLPALRNRYVFARDQGTWRMVSFRRAD
jgi:hypothetical protein